MKLIIDIPEKVVTAIQNGQDYRYDIHTAIAQGKPYDTSGDLISREALKKVLCEEYEAREHYIGKKMLEAIDNAPTITVDEEIERQREEMYQSSKKLYETARMLGVERPQGKWLKKVDNVGFISHICSECGAEIEEEDPCDNNFCFNCGARMEMTKNDD